MKHKQKTQPPKRTIKRQMSQIILPAYDSVLVQMVWLHFGQVQVTGELPNDSWCTMVTGTPLAYTGAPGCGMYPAGGGAMYPGGGIAYPGGH